MPRGITNIIDIFVTRITYFSKTTTQAYLDHMDGV